MRKWMRQPQEQKGDYWFSGECFLTRGVFEEIPTVEIHAIIADLQNFVEQEQGVDYLQVYVDEHGRRLWIMDDLTKEDLQEKGSQEYNRFHILFPDEY